MENKTINKIISKYNFVVNEMIKTENKTVEYFMDLLKVYNKYSKLIVIDSGSVICIDKQFYKIPHRYSGDDNTKLKRNFIRKFLLSKM